MASGAVPTFAPGRVNLIGEHTDYSGGLVLPVALECGVTVTWRPDPAVIRLRSAAFPETVELGADGAARAELTGWVRYAAAVAQLLQERGRPAVGVDGTVSSTVPVGTGLSSSAALTVALALALCRAAEFELPPLELAHLAQEAEHRAVGVPVGLMDPAAALLARRDRALLLDCGTEQHRLVPLPTDLAIVVFDSGVRHSLEHSGYAARRAELERALPSLGGARPSEVTVETAEAAALAAGVDEVARRRLRHVVSENERVRACVLALETSDRDALGALFRASHVSLRDDFEVSIPELDLLVELAYAGGAVAARMTGGGFGGSVVALAERDAAGPVASEVAATYVARSGRAGSGRVYATADGAA
ncbi:MAG TPA: galactokinase [Gaiellaceae bacterium]|nr:galactokinase [Gaiellaceae bacterium]